jgi:antitoxin component YwqK of YwqJK toxin-antitoxin module
MKTNIILSLLIILISSIAAAQKDIEVEYNPSNKLKLYYEDYYIEFEFSVEEKIEIEVDERVYYFWFKENKINKTQGGFEGKVLNGRFTVFYRSGKLKEKGMFNLGLKQGKWKKWFENGNLMEISNWERGKLNGEFIKYQDNGLVLLEAEYSKGRLNGVYKEYSDGVLIIKKRYKDGHETKSKSMIEEQEVEQDTSKVEGRKKKKEKKN